MTSWIDAFKTIIEIIAIIVGGGWALYRFGLFRERFPSMEIENGIRYIGENSKEYLLELYCIVENKGKVRKWLVPLEFFFGFHKKEGQFKKNSWYNDEVIFDHSIHEKGFRRTYWVLPTWHLPFVDGGSKKRFNYLTAISKDYAYLYLYTRFLDFNSRKDAVKYILPRKDKNSIKWETGWDKTKWETDVDNKVEMKKSWEEKIQEVLSQKTDFYFTQVYISIETLKKNSA